MNKPHFRFVFFRDAHGRLFYHVVNEVQVEEMERKSGSSYEEIISTGVYTAMGMDKHVSDEFDIIEDHYWLTFSLVDEEPLGYLFMKSLDVTLPFFVSVTL
jgi:hypothetical protein